MTKKILVVDDEESIHLLYSEEFEEEGYEVHGALSGLTRRNLFSNWSLVNAYRRM